MRFNTGSGLAVTPHSRSTSTTSGDNSNRYERRGTSAPGYKQEVSADRKCVYIKRARRPQLEEETKTRGGTRVVVVVVVVCGGVHCC